MSENDTKVTAEQAAFIEEKTREYFDYVRDSYDTARAEGNNLLQWLFGVATGSIAALGYLIPQGSVNLSIGVVIAAGYAVYAARSLILAMKTRDIWPPGNFARSLNTMLNEPAERMRWLEALGVDERIDKVRNAVTEVADAVDKARRQLANIPILFVVGTVASWLCEHRDQIKLF